MKWTEETIRQELVRLDGMTGLHGGELPIVFSQSARCLGSLRVVGNRPTEFCFSSAYFESDNFAEGSAYDVIRHEYAHYMNLMLNGAACGQPHGKQWKTCARAVGARPQAYYIPSQNALYLKVEKKEKEEAEKMQALLAALQPGNRLMHPAFGLGTICSVESEGGNVRVELAFPCGKKKLGAKWIAQNCRLCEGGTQCTSL